MDKKDGMNILFSTNNHLGDALISTATIRDFAKTFPNHNINLQTNYSDILKGNPYIRNFDNSIIYKIKLCYAPYSQRTASGGNCFNAWRIGLVKRLGVALKYGPDCVDIYYDDFEKERLIKEDYIIINAGNQTCSEVKSYPFWQEIVNSLKNDIKIVQIGGKEDRDCHQPLDGVTNLIGKTSVRDLMRLVRDARVVVSPPSAVSILCTQQGFAGLNIILNGAREPSELTNYNKKIIHLGSTCKMGYTNKSGCMKFYMKETNGKTCLSQVKINDKYYPECMCVDAGIVIHQIKKGL